MRLLLDTHTLLWFLRNDPLLSATARTAIEDPANHKLVSFATCWEMAIVSADVAFDPYPVRRLW